MGLDMYAFWVKADSVIDNFHYNKEDPRTEEMYYWRKHQELHNWMRDLYRKKGGTEKSFNCIPLRLTLDDLDNLTAELSEIHNVMDFADEEDYIDSKHNDMKFITQAKKIIEQGDAVYYDSWW